MKRKRKARRARRARPSKFPSWIPAHLSFEEKYMLQLRERNAVKAADKAVDYARLRNSKEFLAMPFEERRRMLGAAEAAARAAAREDFRRQRLAEIEQAAKAKADLPSHIARIDRDSVKDYLEAAPVRPAISNNKEP